MRSCQSHRTIARHIVNGGGAARKAKISPKHSCPPTTRKVTRHASARSEETWAARHLAGTSILRDPPLVGSVNPTWKEIAEDPRNGCNALKLLFGAPLLTPDVRGMGWPIHPSRIDVAPVSSSTLRNITDEEWRNNVACFCLECNPTC